MSEESHGFYCQLWSDHDLEETYYGHKCKKCELFIPYGSEPWICEAGEHVIISNRGERICQHDRLNEDGICRSCGADCRGIGA